jgi:hypothetical protein
VPLVKDLVARPADIVDRCRLDGEAVNLSDADL